MLSCLLTWRNLVRVRHGGLICIMSGGGHPFRLPVSIKVSQSFSSDTSCVMKLIPEGCWEPSSSKSVSYLNLKRLFLSTPYISAPVILAPLENPPSPQHKSYITGERWLVEWKIAA